MAPDCGTLLKTIDINADFWISHTDRSDCSAFAVIRFWNMKWRVVQTHQIGLRFSNQTDACEDNLSQPLWAAGVSRNVQFWAAGASRDMRFSIKPETPLALFVAASLEIPKRESGQTSRTSREILGFSHNNSCSCLYSAPSALVRDYRVSSTSVNRN